MVRSEVRAVCRGGEREGEEVKKEASQTTSCVISSESVVIIQAGLQTDPRHEGCLTG